MGSRIRDLQLHVRPSIVGTATLSAIIKFDRKLGNWKTNVSAVEQYLARRRRVAEAAFEQRRNTKTGYFVPYRVVRERRGKGCDGPLSVMRRTNAAKRRITPPTSIMANSNLDRE
jgi:hypothetical protein